MCWSCTVWSQIGFWFGLFAVNVSSWHIQNSGLFRCRVQNRRYPNNIRCATKFSLLFDEKATELWKIVIDWSFKVLPNASDNFFISFWKSSYTITVEVFIFSGYPLIKPFWDVSMWVVLLISKNMWNRAEQVNVGRGNIWKWGRLRKTFHLSASK